MPVGFIFGTSVKIYDDVAAVLMTASNVKAPVFVILCRSQERGNRFRDAACWENTLKFCAESVLAVGLNAFKALKLP